MAACSGSMWTVVPAAHASSWAWQERSMVMNHHTASDGEQAVVAQDHRFVVAEGMGDPLALLGVDHHPGVVVEQGVVLVEGADVLGDRLEEPAQGGQRLAVHRVAVGGCDHVGPG